MNDLRTQSADFVADKPDATLLKVKDVSLKRAVAVIGDANDINAWSNIPYFFLQAGKRAGFLNEGLRIEPQRQRVRRLLWNLTAAIRGERAGGFQFSKIANDDLFRQTELSGVSEIISHFQLFPPHDLCRKTNLLYSHYIDLPLHNLFEDYGVIKNIGTRTARKALNDEREQYNDARFVVCMSHWARRQVIERYEIAPEKVHVIIPGANIPEAIIEHHPAKINLDDPPDGKSVPLRIAFVGKDVKRKGLYRLVEGIRILRQRGYKTVLRVIGTDKNLFPDDTEVEHVGFINKLHEPARLLEELRNCHIGALPSYQEALGIAALEYLRCGLPSLITDVGGLGGCIPRDCEIVLAANCSGEDIANELESLLKKPEEFQRMRLQAQHKCEYASWHRVIREFVALWETQREKSDGM